MTTTSIPIMLLMFVGTCLLLLLNPSLAYRTVGFPCRADFQCDSDTFFANTLYCNSTRRCDQKREPGEPCNTHSGCLSGRCSNGVCQLQVPVGGACQVTDDCLDGFCNATTSTCLALKGREEPCVTDEECNSGRCTANPRRCTFVVYEPASCNKDSDCFGGRCNMDRLLNQCYARKYNNVFCNDNSDCLSLRCETTNCTEPVWNGEPCDEPSDCYSLFCSQDGICVATADEAGNVELEPEAPGITGSESAQIANGGGEIDIGADNGGSGGEEFGDGDGDGSGATTAVSRTMMMSTFVVVLVGTVWLTMQTAAI